MFQSSHCNSFEDGTTVDFIYSCPIFKRIAQSSLHGMNPDCNPPTNTLPPPPPPPQLGISLCANVNNYFLSSTLFYFLSKLLQYSKTIKLLNIIISRMSEYFVYLLVITVCFTPLLPLTTVITSHKIVIVSITQIVINWPIDRIKYLEYTNYLLSGPILVQVVSCGEKSRDVIHVVCYRWCFKRYNEYQENDWMYRWQK